MSPCAPDGEVVLVLDAGSDAGHQAACRLLQAGCRVAVTDLHTAPLCRIIHGYSASQVFAVAADRSDHTQLAKAVDAVRRHFGQPVDRIVYADREARLTLVS